MKFYLLDSIIVERPRYRWIISTILSLQYLLVYFHRVSPAFMMRELTSLSLERPAIIRSAFPVFFSSEFLATALRLAVVAFAAAKELSNLRVAGAAVESVNCFAFIHAAIYQPLSGLMTDRAGRTTVLSARSLHAGFALFSDDP